jgi:hypothetical protein
LRRSFVWGFAGSRDRVGHSTWARLLEWPFGMVGLLLYLFALTGVPNVENLPRRARFAAVRRRSPWLMGIASLFFAVGFVCSILYFV